MAPVKSLIPGFLLVGVLGLVAQGAPISKTWKTWSTEVAPIAQVLTAPTNSPSIMTSNPATWPAWQAGTPYADARINLDMGPYPGSKMLTSTPAQPWYTSNTATKVFGHTPSAGEREQFSDAVLQRVATTFELSKIPITITKDPSIPAAHTLSVVGQTSYGPNPDVIGMTYQGGDGVTYFDRFESAQSVDQLAWLVAHNVAHELMHAFGSKHFDTTGDFLDSAVTDWDTMIDPYAKFSDAAVYDLLAKNFGSRSLPISFDGQSVAGMPDRCGCDCGGNCLHGQMVQPAPVPEPASVALWITAASGVVVIRRRGRTPKRALVA